MASQRVWRSVRLCLPLALILLITTYLLSSSPSSSIYDSAWGKEAQGDLDYAEIATRKAQFIERATEWDIDGPFNNTALKRRCEANEWVEGLHFKCASGFGGIGNVRNIVLTCVRYAIEAGATTILMPDITVRGADDLSNLETGNIAPFTYMFDASHFNTSLTSACPQISIITESAERALYPSLTTANLTTKSLGDTFKVVRVVDFLPEWRGAFDKWVKEEGAQGGVGLGRELRVDMQAAWFEFPILYDELEFTASFGRIVRFSHELRQLAAVVLYALDKKYGLEIDAAAMGVPAAEKYYGAHLRTDDDAIKASFAGYEEQSTAYLKGAQQHALSLIYLASGSAKDTKRFTKEAKSKKIAVTGKYALLEGNREFREELTQMRALTWDQQALIDFVVLLRSSHFGGTWASSFAYNIAFQRHVAVENGGWTHSASALAVERDPVVNEEVKEEVKKEGRGEGEKVIGEGERRLREGEVWKDRVSTIYGPPKTGIWFELSMFP